MKSKYKKLSKTPHKTLLFFSLLKLQKKKKKSAMEKGKKKQSSSAAAITLDQFVSTMAPLIDMEKVILLNTHQSILSICTSIIIIVIPNSTLSYFYLNYEKCSVTLLILCFSRRKMEIV